MIYETDFQVHDPNCTYEHPIKPKEVKNAAMPLKDQFYTKTNFWLNGFEFFYNALDYLP